MKAIKKAILLVGGKGSRLMPLTTNVPKPMLRIAGAPVTEHQIIKARDAGVTELVLATSYLADVFKPYFGDGSRFGINIKYAFEDQPLGTGGAIANAAEVLSLASDESIYIFNGDVLSAHDLLAQAELHNRNSAAVTLHLVEVDDARAYGCVPISNEGRVLDFLEKMDNPIAKTINAGCYIFTRTAVEEIPRAQVVSVERETFPQILKSGRPIYGYCNSDYWIDMGTPASMIKASRDLVMNPQISRATPQIQGESLISPTAKVHPNANVGAGSFVEDRVSIGENSHVLGSIIGADSIIEGEVFIENSYLAPHSRVKSGSKLQGEIFGF
jgi:mannose-1-phosphate guanylyltransferase